MARIVKYCDSSILISFHIKSLAARLKLIMMNEGSLDQCTPFWHALGVLYLMHCRQCLSDGGIDFHYIAI